MALTIVIRARKARRDFALERSFINHLLFTDDLKVTCERPEKTISPCQNIQSGHKQVC